MPYQQNQPTEDLSSFTQTGDQFVDDHRVPVYSDEQVEERQNRDLFFQQSTTLLTENWAQTQFLSGRIVEASENFVHCEVVIHYQDGDKESKHFQVRRFPRLLFSHIAPLEEGKTIKIKINQKPGASKTEIFDGKGLGIEKEFEEEDMWQDLEGLKMDEPPKKDA